MQDSKSMAVRALFSQQTVNDSQGLVNDCISRKWLMECVNEGWIKFDTEKDKNIYVHLVRDIAPSAQPELIEQGAYVRGFEQGRTQGMIDAKERKK